MFDDQVITIDSRIKYHECKPGASCGTLKIDTMINDKRVVKKVTWCYPHKSEIYAVNELMSFLRKHCK